MCLACQMEDELWFAYLEQVEQQKKAAAEAAEPPTPAQPPAPATPDKPAPSPFACEELPSE